MNKTYLNYLSALLIATFFFSCQSTEKKEIPIPSGACIAAWNDSTAMEFVTLLEKSTSVNQPTWKDFNLGDGPIVLHAIEAEEGTECLGLWRNGEVLSFLETDEKPKLSTPLYGYQLNFSDLDEEGKENPLVEMSRQPETITNWLNANGAESAVLIPTDFPKFPFKLPARVKVQLAVHESFHVELMLRHWFTGNGPWPDWDQQPNRDELVNCALQGDSVRADLRDEQMTLSHMIEALLDDKRQEAIDLGDAYLAKRKARYTALKDVEITAGDGTKCSCSEAENMMELEEGLADYGSWTMLFEVGSASRASLIQRYQAIQKEPFYLTGAMLMHAAKLMNDNDAMPIIDDIINSNSQKEGAVLTQFMKQLDQYSDGKSPNSRSAFWNP